LCLTVSAPEKRYVNTETRLAMPKANSKRHDAKATTGPYARMPARVKTTNNMFKFNVDIGQHVLKNPGVAQAIVDKADLKQSDVRISWRHPYVPRSGAHDPCRSSSRSDPEPAISR
jgi:hypothetical protein